jgi:predicted nucleic acid-binding protein
MTFVVDASIAVAWFLPDEANSKTDTVLKRAHEEGAHVPDLFWHEMRNVLMICSRRQRLSRDDVDRSMLRLAQLKIITSSMTNSKLILDLAERHSLTAYDAAYLALAIEMTLPLATPDKQLMEAAIQQNVPLPLA